MRIATPVLPHLLQEMLMYGVTLLFVAVLGVSGDIAIYKDISAIGETN